MLTTSCRILTLIYPSFLKSFGLYQKSKKCKELHEIEKYLEVQLWTQEGRNEDTGVQIERRMPPLVWKVDGLACKDKETDESWNIFIKLKINSGLWAGL